MPSWNTSTPEKRIYQHLELTFEGNIRLCEQKLALFLGITTEFAFEATQW